MKKQSTLQLLEIVLELLKKTDEIVCQFGEKIDTKIVYHNDRKRFSDFYRVKLKAEEGKGANWYLWVKVLKNKPHDIIQTSLKKQYDLMTDLFYGLKTKERSADSVGVELSCCKPVGLFLEQSAIVTKECRGIYFDKYLKMHIPFISAKSILKHCFQLGKLLKATHNYYLNSSYLENIDAESCLENYKRNLGDLPHESWRYLTICHNDFSPRNLFVSDRCVELIDFVGLEPGFPQQDLYFFAKYILNAKFNYLYTKGFKLRMVKAFLSGYGIEYSLIFDSFKKIKDDTNALFE